MGMPSAPQIELMRHALGYYRQPRVERNHFAATPGTPDDREWKALVDSGHAKRIALAGENGKATNDYRVTPAGELLVSQARAFARTEG